MSIRVIRGPVYFVSLCVLSWPTQSRRLCLHSGKKKALPLRNAFQKIYSNSLLSGSVGFLRQFALQVSRFVSVDNTAFGQFVDHAGNIREFFTHFFSGGRFQVTDRITGGFSVILISVTTFSRLAGILFCCTVISRLVFNLRSAKVGGQALSTKFPAD